MENSFYTSKVGISSYSNWRMSSWNLISCSHSIA